MPEAFVGARSIRYDFAGVATALADRGIDLGPLTNVDWDTLTSDRRPSLHALTSVVDHHSGNLIVGMHIGRVNIDHPRLRVRDRLTYVVEVTGSSTGLLARYKGTEIDTAGDGFFATFDGPARAMRCALGAIDALADLGIEVRAGVHTGEVETIDGKVGGLAVSIGARIGALAGPSELLASSTVRDLTAGSGLRFEDRGERELKGIPGRWRIYAVKAD